MTPIRRQCAAERFTGTHAFERCTADAGHEGTDHAWPVAPFDPVSNPAHYGGAESPTEAIKAIEAWGLGFCLGNVVKYISRAGKKSGNGLEDLKKARWYLDREIARLEGK